MFSRTRTRLGTALCVLGAFAALSASPLTRVAEACFGYTPPPQPMPECFKSYTFAFGIPETVLFDPAFGGVTIPLDLNHFVGVGEAVPEIPVCPPAPYLISMLATIECDDGTVIDDIDFPFLSHPGAGNLRTFQEISVPADIGCCTITITSSVLFASDCILTQTVKQTFCVVEGVVRESDGELVPRLEIALADDELFVHPGDQAVMTYLIKNNDPDKTVVVELNADMRNVAGTPGGGDFTSTITVSDPVSSLDGDIGDNFPIGFLDQLLPPLCLELPPDPGAEPIPVISRDLEIGPGQCEEITIVSRPWPMCADGSCAASLVIIRGSYTNGDEAKACASAYVFVDNAAPPQFAWPGSGVVGCSQPDPLGGKAGVGAFGLPFPGRPDKPVDVCLLPLPPESILINGDIVPVQTRFQNILAGAADLGKFTGRTDLIIEQPFTFGFPLDAQFELNFNIQVQGGFEGVNDGAWFEGFSTSQGAPQGLENLAPGGMGVLMLPVPDPTCPDVRMDLTHQIVGNGILVSEFGERTVPIEIVALNLQSVDPKIGSVQVRFRPIIDDGSPNRGFPEFLREIRFSNDFRFFFRPDLPLVSTCSADFDGDGDVDLTDFGTFGSAFNSSIGDKNYNAAADFDDDGDVDLTDFGAFGSQFNRTDCFEPF